MRILVRLLLLYRPYWGWLAMGTGIALVTLLANVALMGTSGWFITAMGIAGATGGSLDYFTPAALIRACAIVRTVGRYGERVVTHEATFRLIARLRSWLFRRVEPQPPTVLDGYHSGDLSSRLRTDLDRLETAYLRIFTPVTVALCAGAVILAWMGRFSRSFMLVEGSLLVFSGFAVPWLLAHRSARWGRLQVGQTVRLTEAAVDGIQGMPELLAFGAARRHIESFAALSRDVIALQVKLGRLNGLSQAAMLLGSNLALWSVVVLAIPLLRRGELDPADLVMVALAALAGFEAVAPLPAAFIAFGGVLESAGRIFALADGAPPMTALPGAERRPERCDLRLAAVTFAYRASQSPVIDRLDLDLPQGRRLALVGPMGSGKSTLVLLLAGLLHPSAGQIWLNGRPMDDFAPETLRSCFAVAPQSTSLFSGSIRDNLLLARPDAGDAALQHVLTVAGLTDFLASLPDGLDSWLGETGFTLSGGQARRLSVARALLKDAPVVILDEPGEGLDYQTERAMLRAVADDLQGRSLLLITHRRAGLDLVDEIVSLPLGVGEAQAQHSAAPMHSN